MSQAWILSFALTPCCLSNIRQRSHLRRHLESRLGPSITLEAEREEGICVLAASAKYIQRFRAAVVPCGFCDSSETPEASAELQLPPGVSGVFVVLHIS
jgi:hypothetical protein